MVPGFGKRGFILLTKRKGALLDDYGVKGSVCLGSSGVPGTGYEYGKAEFRPNPDAPQKDLITTHCIIGTFTMTSLLPSLSGGKTVGTGNKSVVLPTENLTEVISGYKLLRQRTTHTNL